MKLKKKLAQPFCRELGVPPASSRPGATHSCRLQGAWQAPFPFPCLTHWHPAFLHTFFFRLYCKKLAQSAPFCSVAVHCFFAHMQFREPFAARGRRLQSFFFAAVQGTSGVPGLGVAGPGPGGVGPGVCAHTPVSLACW